jgi:Cation transporter/ATPase, N-terminus
VNPDAGLTSAEADARRKEHGYNEVAEKKGRPVLKYLGKFWGISAWMLELIMVLSVALGNYSDLAVVGALLIVNAALGFMQERRAGLGHQTLTHRTSRETAAIDISRATPNEEAARIVAHAYPSPKKTTVTDKDKAPPPESPPSSNADPLRDPNNCDRNESQYPQAVSHNRCQARLACPLQRADPSRVGAGRFTESEGDIFFAPAGAMLGLGIRSRDRARASTGTTDCGMHEAS